MKFIKALFFLTLCINGSHLLLGEDRTPVDCEGDAIDCDDFFGPGDSPTDPENPPIEDQPGTIPSDVLNPCQQGQIATIGHLGSDTSVKIRAGAGKNFESIGKLSVGQEVSIEGVSEGGKVMDQPLAECQSDDQNYPNCTPGWYEAFNSTWYEIKHNGQKAYISALYAICETSEVPPIDDQTTDPQTPTDPTNPDNNPGTDPTNSDNNPGTDPTNPDNNPGTDPTNPDNNPGTDPTNSEDPSTDPNGDNGRTPVSCEGSEIDCNPDSSGPGTEPTNPDVPTDTETPPDPEEFPDQLDSPIGVCAVGVSATIGFLGSDTTVNVRSGAGQSFPSIGSLALGETISIKAVVQGDQAVDEPLQSCQADLYQNCDSSWYSNNSTTWYEITYKNGKKAYVSALYAICQGDNNNGAAPISQESSTKKVPKNNPKQSNDGDIVIITDN